MNNPQYQAMSQYFEQKQAEKQAEKDDLKDFRNEVMANPVKFADKIIKEVNSNKQSSTPIGVPFSTVTFTNNEQTVEKMHARELIVMIQEIKDEAEQVYKQNVRNAHWSLLAKEQVDLAKKTYQQCDIAINKLKKAL